VPPRPRIAVNQDKGDVFAAAVDGIEASNEPPVLFRRGGLLSRIGRDDENLPVIIPLSRSALRAQLAVSLRWVKDGRDGESPVPPDDVALDGVFTHADRMRGVPVIDQVVTAPVFAPNGVLELNEGYSPHTHSWYEAPRGMQLYRIPDRPQQRDASAALAWLAGEYLGDFPFDGEPSRMRALSLLLMPFARMLVDGPVPLYTAESATPGTGKGLLQRACLLPALGTRLPVSSGVLSDDAELRKSITTQLMRGHPVIRWDNVACKIDSPVLAALVTEPVWHDRMLGMNVGAEIAVRAICAVNGNNLRFSQEMARRLATVRIDAVTEHPEHRTGFRHGDLIRWGTQNRGLLVTAALTVVKAWLCAGRPPGHGTMGSFESWAAVMGGIVEHATGWRGVLLDGLDLAYESGTDERSDLADFLAAWFAEYGSTQVSVGDVGKLLFEHDPFGLPEAYGRSRDTQVGFHLHRIKGQVYNGLRVQKPTRTSRKWLVQRV